MAAKRQRVFALFGAVLFLLTSSFLTIAVVYELAHQSKNSGSSTNAADSSTNSGSSTSKSSTTDIAGTKMADFTPLTQKLTKLEVTDTKVGTGAVVKAGDTITADYVGALADTGVIFDASQDHGGPQTFSLSEVIEGWQQGIPGMRVGGTRQLLIPAALAYGSTAQSGIPANSDLVFTVTVTKID